MHARSSLLQLAAFPRGGLTPAEAPLIDAEILFRQPQPPKTMTRPNVASIFGAFLVVAVLLSFAQTNAQTFFDLNALAGDASNSVRSAISPICFCPQLLPYPALFSKPKVGMLDAKKISN